MSKFVMQSEMTTDHVDLGSIGWRARPENTSCKTFVVMDVGLEPGFGHDFHRHPDQDELITVLAGTMFRVELPNKHQVLATISGKMRKRFVRLTIGDRVKMEMSPYDLTKARIVWRLG